MKGVTLGDSVALDLPEVVQDRGSERQPQLAVIIDAPGRTPAAEIAPKAGFGKSDGDPARSKTACTRREYGNDRCRTSAVW